MQYREPDIIKCPNCGTLYYKHSLASGNTFGAKLYSDGNMRAPMLPSLPSITKCKKCNIFFKVNNAEILPRKDKRKGKYTKSTLFSSIIFSIYVLLSGIISILLTKYYPIIGILIIALILSILLIITLTEHIQDYRNGYNIKKTIDNDFIISAIIFILISISFILTNIYKDYGYIIYFYLLFSIIGLLFTFIGFYALYLDKKIDLFEDLIKYNNDSEKENSKEYNNILDIDFLTIEEILEFLEKENYDILEELKIRKELWYLYNDRVKDDKKLFQDKNDENIYNKNLKKLIIIYGISYDKDDEKLMIGEMYRNLGNFTKAKSIYKLITTEKLIEYKETLIKECNNKNKLVILLN